MHMYNELAHIPLLVRFPEGKMAGERVNLLTQNIDIMPTVLDYSDRYSEKMCKDFLGKI